MLVLSIILLLLGLILIGISRFVAYQRNIDSEKNLYSWRNFCFNRRITSPVLFNELTTSQVYIPNYFQVYHHHEVTCFLIYPLNTRYFHQQFFQSVAFSNDVKLLMVPNVGRTCYIIKCNILNMLNLRYRFNVIAHKSSTHYPYFKRYKLMK